MMDTFNFHSQYSCLIFIDILALLCFPVKPYLSDLDKKQILVNFTANFC